MASNLRAWTLYLGLLTVGIPSSPAESELPWLAARSLTIPVYLEQEPHPAAMIRVRRVARDLDQRGPFHIGALPLVTMENVVIEIPDPTKSAALPGALRRLQALPPRDRRIVVRQVRIQVGTSTPRFIAAKRLRFPTRSGHWPLEEVDFGSGEDSRQVDRGMLIVEPSGSVRFEWRNNGHQKTGWDLIGPSSANTPR